MAAAYAALVSLMNTVDAIQNHPRLFTSLDKYQAQSLKEKLDSLLQFVEDYDFRGGKSKDAVEDLKSQIGSAAHAAEVVIEAHIVDRNIIKHSLDLQKMIEVMRSYIEKFEDYVYYGPITKEVEALKTHIEYAAHAADVMIRDGAKESVQGSLTQGITKEAVEDLKTRIASAALAAEIVLQYVVDFGFHGGRLSEEHALDMQKIIEDMGSFMEKLDYVKGQMEHEHYSDEEQSLDLQKIIDDMGSHMEKVNNVKEQMGHEDQKPIYSMPNAAPSRSYSGTGKTNMVGFDGYMDQLKDRLTGDRSNWQVIPITGMGGIGKTTLAINVYDDLLIVQHFDKRAWVTVSQEYSVRKILVEILSSVGGSTGGLDEKSENELGGEMYKILFGWRYLIILDDMWSIDAWEKLHSFFPKQENGSRIVVTTRQLDMARYFDTSALILGFLDDYKSWQLFCEKVFAHEVCPPELEGIGRKIVKKCGGLPLSIAVIGGLLGKSSRVHEYWENVERDMSSIVNLAEENICLDILSLSYNHLPTPLKPCFLYLGIFPEDTEIPMTRLVRLWVAEGFLKPNKDQSLEEIGEGYVKDLKDRNLIVVQRDGVPQDFMLNRYLKTYRICKVHDLLRELCTRTAEKEKFFYVMSGLDTSRHIDRECLSVFHKIILRGQGYPHQVLSLSVRGETQHQNCELWRVLFDHAYDSTIPTCKQVSLRYSEGNVPWYRHPPLGWNLQTYMDREAPFNKASLSEIWKMTQLRHVEGPRIRLPDPPSGDNHDRIVLKNLQTLGTVENFKCSEEVCKRMPNIKKLSIEYRRDFFRDEVIGRSTLLNYISNVGCFNKLKSLKYFFYDDPKRDELLKNLKFPNSLKKLRIHRCNLHWDDLTIIGSLPHLEALKLNDDAVQGPEWNPIENQFCSLKSLEVESNNLINWNADRSHFPILEKLTLRTPILNEIPESIGEIPTLRVISVHNCRVSVAISALKILKEQEDLGNNDIKVLVDCKTEIREEVREWVEQERISTDNVQFKEDDWFSEYFALPELSFCDSRD